MKRLSLILVALVIFSCSKSSDTSTDSSPSSAAQMSDTFTDSVNGVLSNTGLVAAMRAPKKSSEMIAKFMHDLLLPEAQAATCAQPGGHNTSSCSAGEITTTFDCHIGLSSNVLTGSTTLTYDNGTCDTSGDFEVTRTVDLTITGNYGGTLTVSSASHTDYLGASIGGGQKLTVASGAKTFQVLGMNRILTGPGGHKYFDISTHTTADFTVTGSSLSNLTLDGGTLDIIHNLAEYTASWTANNIQWSANCYCPVSGTATGTFTGSVTGTMTIQYGSTCGEATVTGLDGNTSTVTLSVCSSI